ncbi:MAG: hypothetical protein HW412_2527 [Bacteroidetes bacterium]|nr:hypothetical protein [Bacteroidota bacterium]
MTSAIECSSLSAGMITPIRCFSGITFYLGNANGIVISFYSHASTLLREGAGLVRGQHHGPETTISLLAHQYWGRVQTIDLDDRAS